MSCHMVLGRRFEMISYLIALLAFLSTVGCVATDPSGITRVLTQRVTEEADDFALSCTTTTVPMQIDVLMNAARKFNPGLLMLRDVLETLRVEAMTVTDLRNPELRLAYDQESQITERSWWRDGVSATGGEQTWSPIGSASDHTEESDIVRLGLRFFPPNPWLMRAGMSEARARLAAANADLQAAEWRVECAIGRIVSEIHALREERKIALQLETLREDVSRDVDALLRRQQTTITDELDNRQRLLRAKEEVIDLDRSIAQQLDQLVLLCGVTPDMEHTPVGEMKLDLPEDELRMLEDSILESRQDILAAYWRHQESLAALRGAKARRIPWISYLQGTYAKGNSTEPLSAASALNEAAVSGIPSTVITTDDRETEEWGLEAAIEIPLLTIHKGATRIERAQAQRRALALKQAIRNAGVEWGAAKLRWSAAREKAVRCKTALQEHRARISIITPSIQQAGDIGPEPKWKLREIELQLRHSDLQANREMELAYWRLREACGRRIGGSDTPDQNHN